MRGNETVAELVERARSGDKVAWDALVVQFAPLVWSICFHHRLSRADAEDVGQGVWMRLVEELDNLREPAALPGWLATTTRRECQRVLRLAARREYAERRAGWESRVTRDARKVEDGILEAERQMALRLAFAQLPQRCQRLLELLLHDPPLPYAEIGERIGMPVGGLGPNRARCLEKLRRHPVFRSLIEANDENLERGDGDD